MTRVPILTMDSTPRLCVSTQWGVLFSQANHRLLLEMSSQPLARWIHTYVTWGSFFWKGITNCFLQCTQLGKASQKRRNVRRSTLELHVPSPSSIGSEMVRGLRLDILDLVSFPTDPRHFGPRFSDLRGGIMHAQIHNLAFPLICCFPDPHRPHFLPC